MRNIQVYSSKKNQPNWLEKQSDVPFINDENEHEMQLIMLYGDICYQTINGFGGAFTPSAAETFFGMSKEIQDKILELIFSKNGLNYSCGRNSIGACDFSKGNYSYCDKSGDIGLKTFSIKEDEKLVIPFILKAIKYRGEKITLLSSPWSPPMWMKTNNSMLHGGKLKREYYSVWADYFVKYIMSYLEKGITVDYVTVQNEPKAVQKWESCIYTSEEEKIFIRDYLYPKFLEAGLMNVKIIIWDHNKERLFERARYILADEKAREAISGIAFHWYSGDHFENIGLCKEMFPDMELIFTEGCVELTTKTTSMAQKANQDSSDHLEASQSPWEFGECYAHDIFGDLNSGMNLYIDWNMMLNQQGGPNHVDNFCSAPIICDTEEDKIYLQPSYCFISHFSRFIESGSKRIAYSKYTNSLEVVAAITPGNKKVAVIMNPTDRKIPYILKDVESNQIAYLEAEEKSIYTLIYE